MAPGLAAEELGPLGVSSAIVGDAEALAAPGAARQDPRGHAPPPLPTVA